ncbi:MAG: glycosyltransferase family 2 protein [Planctomycetota bacterium]
MVRDNPRILVIIPCYNEEATVRELAETVRQYADVCIVDDGSTDRTSEILKRIDGIHVITHKKNTHIPTAIKDGMSYAVSNEYHFAVTMDAGFSHHPKALPQFFQQTDRDIIIGSRTEKVDVPLYRKIISWLGAKVVNYGISESWFDFRGPGIKDTTSGFRMYSKGAMERIVSSHLRSKSFDFHMEALSIVFRTGGTIKEIPIKYTYSNTSFNLRVFRQAIAFGYDLLKTKGKTRNNTDCPK